MISTITLSAQDDPHFSYRIFKNPNGDSYIRNSNGKKIIGQYNEYGEYEIFIVNEEHVLPDFNKLSWNYRELNALSVVELNIVFTQVLRSATYDKRESNLSEEEHNLESEYILSLVPIDKFSYDEQFVEIAKQLGLSLHYSEFFYSVNIATVNTMRLPEFLQKCYVLMFGMLAKHSFFATVSKDKVDQLVRLSDSWLNQLDDKNKNYLVKRIMLFKSGNLKRFENELEESDFEIQEQLHQQKHDLLIELLKEWFEQSEFYKRRGFYNVMEFGCSKGQLARKLDKLDFIRYVGVDKDENSIRTAKRRAKGEHFSFVQKDFISHYVDVYTTKSSLSSTIDILYLVEVIEHLTEEERKFLPRLIQNVYVPSVVYLTTPNVTANVELYGMEEGELRHWNHKIEFTKEELVEYLNLFEDYEYEFIEMENYEIQPSFLVKLTRKNIPLSIDSTLIEELIQNEQLETEARENLTSPIFLEHFSYTVNEKELEYGLNSRHMRNADDIFYIGATMPPVEHGGIENMEDSMFSIEDVSWGLDYYAKRGVYTTRMVGEVKYMGSRGYILAFSNQEIADKYNMPLVSVRSRNGYEFWETEEDKELYNSQIHSQLVNSGAFDGAEMLILDSEILPWSYKAKELIDKEFRVAVEMLMEASDNLIKHKENVELDLTGTWLEGRNLEDLRLNLYKWLYQLKTFAKDSNVEIRVFDILAKVKYGKYRPQNIEYGKYRTRLDVNAELVEWFGNNESGKHGILKAAKQVSDYDILSLWKTMDNKYEGIVLKPNRLSFLSNGAFIQPYMKARRDSYLRLIYGPFWKEEPFATKVLNRYISAKRRRALFEHEMSHLILAAFVENKPEMKRKYLAAFWGARTNRSPLDKTL